MPPVQKHRDLLLPRRIERAADVIGKLRELAGFRIHGPLEAAHRYLEAVARVDDQHVGIADDAVPVFRLDIGAGAGSRVEVLDAERHDLALQLHLQPPERHRRRRRAFDVDAGEAAREERTIGEEREQRVDRLFRAGDRAVDALGREEDRALDAVLGAEAFERLAEVRGVRQRGKAIEGGDLERHAYPLAGGAIRRRRQAEKGRLIARRGREKKPDPSQFAPSLPISITCPLDPGEIRCSGSA